MLKQHMHNNINTVCQYYTFDKHKQIWRLISIYPPWHIGIHSKYAV